jgi:lysozyme
MSRKALADAVRPFAPGGKLQQAHIPALDALADALGLPREGEGRRTSQRGIDLIHSFEQCKLTAYPDPGSSDGHPWTIGWGSTGPGIAPGTVWTQEQADTRFAADLQKYERGVSEALNGAPVTQNQFDALVSFAYNVGIGAMAGSTLMKLHKAGDYGGAARQFARWNRNDGKVMKGLIRRRDAEAALYSEGL